MAQLQTIAVTGASGLIGKALVSALTDDGRTVRRLVRHSLRMKRASHEDRGDIFWNPATGEIDRQGLEGVDGVVHLAGENVAAKGWTPQQKRAIADSRVQGTRLLCQTLASLDAKPRALLSASAIGFYGDRGAEPVDERSPAGAGFLADTCVHWEAETRPAWEAGLRVVQLRIGVVIAKEGGALPKMLPQFQLGLGATLGQGSQMMSWVALEDVVAAIQFTLDHESLHEAVNVTAPHAVTNREFTKTLGRVLRRPTVLSAPAFVLRTALGEIADEMLLSGAEIRPNRLLDAGFEFRHPHIESALRSALGK